MIKNVVGVYVGLENDGRTPCLHVMLAQDSSEARQAIPSQIEGYKVVVEMHGRNSALAESERDRITALSAEQRLSARRGRALWIPRVNQR